MATIGFFTYDIIYETENWDPFNLDFKNSSDGISAYGSLIGAILSFLSVMFVLYNILEVRGQIEDEKNNKLLDEKLSLLNKLKLVSNIFISTTDEITSQGKIMKEFYEQEKANPSQMHTMSWHTNRHFGRLMNLDFEQIFQAFQTYFVHESNWNKILLNLYNLNDFYGDAFTELKQKYSAQINFKVSEQKAIGNTMNELMDKAASLVDIYRTNYGMASYLNFPWSQLMNNYISTHYNYLESVIAEGEMPDFRYISNNLLLPFLQEAMAIREDIGFDAFGSKEIVSSASNIRKKINEIEVYCLQYAGDIEKQYNKYFSEDNDSIKLYKDLKSKIDNIINTNSLNNPN